MSKMKIALDGYEANVPQRLGSSKFAFELIRNIEQIDKKNEYVILLPSEPMDDLPKERHGWRYKILKPKKLWTRIALPLYLYTEKRKLDIFFSPTHYIPRFSPIKRIVTIFDLSFLHFPESFLKKDLWQLTNWTKFSALNASEIVTISNSSKKDIIQQYKINKDKITVIYPGYDKEKFKVESVSKETALGRTKSKIEEIKQKYGIKDNYIIYIGTVQPRKNLVRLIEATSRIPGLNLVIVGKTSGEGREGWMYEDILQAPSKLGVADRVIFTGFVPTQELPYLISGAQAFVQPSLWEGFGIPVVEAMACKVPVLVSNVSSLPEVIGKAGLVFDPYSVDQIEQAIRVILTDKKLRQKILKESSKRVKRFSWKQAAKEVIKVFEQVGQK